MQRRLRRLVALVFQYFLRGVLLFLPALATVYVLWVLLQWLDGILPIGLPGLGLLLLVLSLTLLGYIGTHWLGPTIIASFEARIRKVPFVGFIYSSVRELVDSSRRGYRFDRPVLVRLSPHTEAYQIGFLTHDKPLSHQPELVAVYLPYSFGFMGKLLIVPRAQVEPLPMKAAEALRFVVSGGLIEATSYPQHDPGKAPDLDTPPLAN
ncbi:MAG: hypothetical protein KatS3mg026_0352 [Bacteroidia bacterium]|nr:MAG: hypothetical protein KatS3mg026_0352 [Bacteroidia bacterium]